MNRRTFLALPLAAPLLSAPAEKKASRLVDAAPKPKFDGVDHYFSGYVYTCGSSGTLYLVDCRAGTDHVAVRESE